MSETTVKRSKKPIAIAAVVAVLLAVGGAAYAYWTVTGAGTGSAATGTTANIVVNQTSTITNLRPGGAPQTLSGNFTNTSNDGPVYVTTVSAAVGTVTKATGAPTGDCLASDYVIVNSPVAVGADVPAGSNQGNWGNVPASAPTIAFVNKSTNQDACKGATVTIAYTSN